MRIGVVGTAAGWSTEKLADAVEKLTGFRLIVDMKKIRLDLVSGKVWHDGEDLAELDGLIIKKIGGRYSQNLLDRLEILRMLYDEGMPIFSSPIKIMRVLDRLSCTLTLYENNIPLPPTTITEDVDEAMAAIEEYGESILKPLYSSKARGMVKLSRSEEARGILLDFKRENQIIYIQKKIDLPGKDLGVVFLGGEYLTTYARCQNGDSWTTSTAFGGTYEPYEPSPGIIELARKAQAPFGLDFTCVDVAETSAGPVIFEVSAFGGFRGIYRTSTIEAAEEYARYVIDKIEKQGG